MKDVLQISAINQRFGDIRQGDFVLVETSFLSVTDCRFPGMIVISQTCEIIRDYNQRSTVKVAALCEASDVALQEIKRLRKPRYAYLSALAGQNLVVDLDFVMTLDKKVCLEMDFQRGCPTDPELMSFQQQLERNIGRFAFPDDFVANLQAFNRMIQKKHDKPEAGMAMRMIREIRILANPGWEDPEEITFYFILDDEAERNDSIEQEIQTYMSKIKKEPPYDQVSPLIVYLEDMTAAEYLATNRLDFDYLTQRSSHG